MTSSPTKDSTRATGSTSATGVPEVFFYHLEHSPLVRVLPNLLEKTLARGWRAVVEAGAADRLAALDDVLWTWKDDSFLPHATSSDGEPAAQPILLTTGAENPNGAAVRFLLEGADVSSFGGYARIIYMFDGHDPGAVTAARGQWKRAKEAGCKLAYWQQEPGGGWKQKA